MKISSSVPIVVMLSAALFLSTAMAPSTAHACRCPKVIPKSFIAKHDFIAKVRVTRTRQIGKWSSRLNARSTLSIIARAKTPDDLKDAKSADVIYEGNFANARRSSCATELPFAQEFWLAATVKDGQLRTHECSLAPLRGQFANQPLKQLLEEAAE